MPTSGRSSCIRIRELDYFSNAMTLMKGLVDANLLESKNHISTPTQREIEGL